MKLTFLGTGDAGRVPAYGCGCPACLRAKEDRRWRRTACSVEVQGPEGKFLIDAGQTNLPERYPAGTLDAILLTHYHMDHVLGLFHLRWGENTRLPVYGSKDDKGCDDLYRHPGILDFKTPLSAFQALSLAGIRITPIPLQHSKSCLGYLLLDGKRAIAYLTDTLGLSEESARFLSQHGTDLMIVDCTHSPNIKAPRNHNNWQQVQLMEARIGPKNTLLTHISHEMDCWLIKNDLPAGFAVAQDNMQI